MEGKLTLASVLPRQQGAAWPVASNRAPGFTVVLCGVKFSFFQSYPKSGFSSKLSKFLNAGN